MRLEKNNLLLEPSSKMTRAFSSGVLMIYRVVFSPVLHVLAGPGFGCRFMPSCSQYLAEALRVHGFFKGIVFGLMRLGRCQPFGSSGYDPVPPLGGRVFKKR